MIRRQSLCHIPYLLICSVTRYFKRKLLPIDTTSTQMFYFYSKAVFTPSVSIDAALTHLKFDASVLMLMLGVNVAVQINIRVFHDPSTTQEW